jgi:hypothetical protein
MKIWMSVMAVWGNVGGCGEGKKEGHRPASGRCPVMSDVLNEVRTFFEGEEGENS